MVHYDVSEAVHDGGPTHHHAIHDAMKMNRHQMRAFHKAASVLHHIGVHHPDADHEKLGHIAHAHLATLGPVKTKEELGAGFFGDLWKGIKSAASTVWKGVKAVARPLLDVASTIGPVVATALGQPELAPVIGMAASAASQALGGGYADPDELAGHIVSYMKDGKGGSFDGLVQHIVRHSHKEPPVHTTPFAALADSKCHSCVVRAIEKDHGKKHGLLEAVQVTKKLMPHIAKAI